MQTQTAVSRGAGGEKEKDAGRWSLLHLPRRKRQARFMNSVALDIE